MQLWPRRLCRPGLHRSAGLQRTQAIRMTRISEPRTLADETNGCSSERAQTEVDSWPSVSGTTMFCCELRNARLSGGNSTPQRGVTFVSR
jgi:hypothetical protein